MIKPYYEDDAVTLYHGDCLDVLAGLPDASVDAIVTDPPYGLRFMGKAWDGADIEAATATRRGQAAMPDDGRSGANGGYRSASTEAGRYDLSANAAFGHWCELWARECLRILKPGGHFLSFGGSRTWHRLAAAVEDAGFEIRDSIAWLYGSGFPKSLDVSKAIDKSVGAERSEVSGSKLGRPGMAKDGSNQSFDGSRVYGSGGILPTDILAPATSEAAQWSGWGTALKPAFEPIVVARKPLAGTVNVMARIEHELRLRGITGEIEWTRPASGAGKRSRTAPSGTTQPQPTAGTSARTASASEMQNTGNETGSNIARPAGDGVQQTRTITGPNAAGVNENSAKKSSTPTAESVPAAESGSRHSSPSTTSTAAELNTASQSTARSTQNYAGSGSLPGSEFFAGIATGLTGSRAHVRIDRNKDGTFTWPVDLPEVTKVPSTVAANVLEHGTGALNIDGCRIETEDTLGRTNRVRDPRNASSFLIGDGSGTFDRSDKAGGRWPANVVLDESQAEALDEQSGSSRSTARVGTRTGKEPGTYGAFTGQDNVSMGHDDKVGASRFFYTAKAAQAERITHNGIAHPTVKPLDLMRWLVRLVTPPGGTILEPFAGSGTTVEAAIIEGFHCIAIERETAYLPLITQRINRRRDPIAYLTEAGDDLGLFGEESA